MRKYIESFAIGSAIMLTNCGASQSEQMQRHAPDSTATQVRFTKADANIPDLSENTANFKNSNDTPIVRIDPPGQDPAEGVTPEAVRIYTRLCFAAIESEQKFKDEMGDESDQSCYEILMRRNRLLALIFKCYRLNIPGIEFKVTDPEIKAKLETVRVKLVPIVEEVQELNNNPYLRPPSKKEEHI
jgi:hypothetical protein